MPTRWTSIRGDILNQIKGRSYTVGRFVVLAIACIAFILCGISVSAARKIAKHKGLSRLSVGLKSVKESAKKARQRFAALKKREDILLSKIDEAKDEANADDNQVTTSFAKVELAKVRYEKRALTKKIKTCEQNRTCIMAEIEVVSNAEVEPIDPLQQDIRFRRPINGEITSKFGMRMHPLDHVEKLHQGIDFAGNIGDPVKASAVGKVVFAGIQRGYGKFIVLQHTTELSTAYGHLSAISVEVGDLVAQGDKIGEVGMTGNSTGPHLHFEIRENGDNCLPKIRQWGDIRTGQGYLMQFT